MTIETATLNFANPVFHTYVLAGTIMVFRSFDRMSYALVMEAQNELQVLDVVRNPI